MRLHRGAQALETAGIEPLGRDELGAQAADLSNAVLSLAEVCQILGFSTRTGRRLRQYRTFPIPEMDSLLKRRPRYRRVDVVRYVSDQKRRGW